MHKRNYWDQFDVTQVSVLTIDTKSGLLFFTQQIGDVSPTAYVQSLRYPF